MNRKQPSDRKRLHVKKEHLKELGKDQLAKARGASSAPWSGARSDVGGTGM